MDLLKRNLSPIPDAAWNEIDDVAREILTANLSARKFVSIIGPKGWDYGAVPTGRLDVKKAHQPGEVCYGIYTFRPLVESRITFELEVWELDNIIRGAKDVELDSLEDAAKKIALFEEEAIYKGLKQAGIVGLTDVSEHDKVVFEGSDSANLLSAIVKSVRILKEASVSSPYTMVVDPDIWDIIMTQSQGYPMSSRIKDLLDNGNIIYSRAAEGAFITPSDAEDLEMTLGQDFSIGYESRTEDKVKLFIAESFTFRVLDPNVVIHIKQE